MDIIDRVLSCYKCTCLEYLMYEWTVYPNTRREWAGTERNHRPAPPPVKYTSWGVDKISVLSGVKCAFLPHASWCGLSTSRQGESQIQTRRASCIQNHCLQTLHGPEASASRHLLHNNPWSQRLPARLPTCRVPTHLNESRPTETQYAPGFSGMPQYWHHPLHTDCPHRMLRRPSPLSSSGKHTQDSPANRSIMSLFADQSYPCGLTFHYNIYLYTCIWYMTEFNP